MKTKTINEYTVVMNGMDMSATTYPRGDARMEYESAFARANTAEKFGTGNRLVLKILDPAKTSEENPKIRMRTREEMKSILENADVYVAFENPTSKQRSLDTYMEHSEVVNYDLDKLPLAKELDLPVVIVGNDPDLNERGSHGHIEDWAYANGIRTMALRNLAVDYYGNPNDLVKLLAYAIKDGFKGGIETTGTLLHRGVIKPLEKQF